jgi:hypothetical protein
MAGRAILGVGRSVTATPTARPRAAVSATPRTPLAAAPTAALLTVVGGTAASASGLVTPRGFVPGGRAIALAGRGRAARLPPANKSAR